MKKLNLIEKSFLLKKTFLFADLNIEELLAIADKSETFTLDKGDYIFYNDQTPLHIYIIAEGTIQLLTPSLEPLTTLSPGGLFGDEALFGDTTHRYRAKTLEKCQLLALTKKHLTTIISECPSVAIHLLEAFAKHVSFRHATPSAG